MSWADLPDILLEEIFSMLIIRDRLYVSLVCRNWSRIVQSSKVWEKFVFKEFLLTRRRFNYYKGYEHSLEPFRTQICLSKVSMHWRKLIILPNPNFYHLYEFINILTHFCEANCDYYDLENVQTFYFEFACQFQCKNIRSEVVYGTGGKLLEALKQLLSHLKGLKSLSLNHLLLDCHEAVDLLEDIWKNCETGLKKLRLINCTKTPFSFLHIGVFLNLQKLVISPQHLSEDLIYLLSYTALRDLHILQNVFTSTTYPIPYYVWDECKKASPFLRVYLENVGPAREEMFWQEQAPVKSILYETPYIRVTPQSIVTVIENYKNTLEIYGFKAIPRNYIPKSFHDRADSNLLLLVRQCLKLRILIVHERISTATILLLAYTCKNLEKLLVRKNAIIKRCDWPKSPEWTQEFYQWLHYTSHSYTEMEKEISSMLRYNWSPLTDKQFKMINSWLPCG